MEKRSAELLETGEEVIFDKRHSLWEIWRNFLFGAGAIVALILLLTKFKPGPQESEGSIQGYVILISILAAFVLIVYGIFPFFRRRRLKGEGGLLPILVMIVTIGVWVALFWFRDSPDFADTWKILAWIGFFLVVAMWLVYPILKWYFTHFILTDRRVIFNSGILTKKSKMIPLDQINDLTGSQNLWERVFRYGDVIIESAGEFGQEAFTNISYPAQVRSQILQHRRLFEEAQASRSSKETAREMKLALQEQGVSGTGIQASQSMSAKAELELVDGLKKLDELRLSGALTEEEFQEAKRELMDKLRGQ